MLAVTLSAGTFWAASFTACSQVSSDHMTAAERWETRVSRSVSETPINPATRERTTQIYRTTLTAQKTMYHWLIDKLHSNFWHNILWLCLAIYYIVTFLPDVLNIQYTDLFLQHRLHFSTYITFFDMTYNVFSFIFWQHNFLSDFLNTLSYDFFHHYIDLLTYDILFSNSSTWYTTTFFMIFQHTIL